MREQERLVSAMMKNANRLRVFMTADAMGGVWQYALDLASGLKPLGVETVLAIIGPNPSAAQRSAADAAGLALVETELPLDWTARQASEIEAAAWALARLATDTQPDIVHLNSPALAACASFPAPVVAVAHSCVATWWAANRTGPLPTDFVWRTDMTRRGYLSADLIVAPTAAFAAATRRAYGLTLAPTVVHNGRRPAGLPAAAAEPVVFTAGRLWDDGKNLATLDRAAARLSAPVLAAGPLAGPNGARVAVKHVQALGSLDDRQIAQRLSGRPVFVSAARYEPFGLAVLEAAQAGCALVLSDISTFRELWDGAAIFVSADDDVAFARSIDVLLRDSQMRYRLGRAAKARSRAYSVEAMSARMLPVYRSLVATSACAAVEDAVA
jgi:glycosyltransferase involved in cell wall biosynthesis